jgi:peptide/nickel transport system permease protein
VISLILVIAVLDATRVYRLARAVAHEHRGDGLYRGRASCAAKGTWYLIRREDPAQRHGPPRGRVRPALLLRLPLHQSALSFLGLGIQPPTADWGSMVRENATLITFGDMTPLLPAACIALLTIAMNFVVDWFMLMKTSG